MKCTIIGITGGTGSGKSTFTNRLKNEFPDDVAVIYHDNYYRCQDAIPFEARKKVNYDHPDSLETDLLTEHLKKLKAGESIECPVYDYSQHNRSKETLHIEPKYSRGRYPSSDGSTGTGTAGHQNLCGCRCG